MMIVGRKSFESIEVVNTSMLSIAGTCIDIRELDQPTLSRYLMITAVMEQINVLIPKLTDLERVIRKDDAKNRKKTGAHTIWEMEWGERGSNSVIGYLGGAQLLLQSLHDCLDVYRLHLDRKPDYALLVSRLLGFCINTGLLIVDPEVDSSTVKYRDQFPSFRPANWNLTSEAIH